MSWRIVSVSSMSKLDYKMGYLVVRNRDNTTRIHLSEISILMLESTAISLTAYLLRELERQKIDVIFCDETRTPYGMLSSLYGSHDTALRFHAQIKWSRSCMDEIDEFYRSVFYEKLDVLLIEPVQRGITREGESRTIIDEDLCVIN